MSKIKDWVNTHKKNIKIAIIVALSILILFSLVFVRTTQRDVTFSYTESVDLNSLQAIGYVHEKGVFKSHGIDPQIWIPITDKKINDVCVKFSSKISSVENSQLYYSLDNSLQEKNSISKAVNYQSEVYFTIPEGVYRILRFDMPGEFKIESITLSYATEVREYTKYVIKTDVLIWLSVIAAIVLAAIFVFDKQIKSKYNFIRDKYFTSEEITIVNARKTANLFFVCAIISGLVFILLNPPFVCPDEHAHFINVCRISHGEFFAKAKDGMVGCTLTQKEVDFITTYGGLYNNFHGEKFQYLDIYNFTQDQSSTYLRFFPTEYATINPTPYMIPGLAALLARTFINTIHPYSLLLFAKMANLLFSALITRFAILKTPIMRNTMFVIALMPMTMYQCSSVSYDAVTIPACFLLFAYGAKIILEDKDYIISLEDIVAICVSFLLICGSKIAYAPLILVLLTVSIKKFGSLKRYFTCISIIAAIGIVFYVIPVMINNIITSDVSFSYSSEIAAQREYYYANIWKTPTIVKETTKYFAGYWLLSYFGILGALDTYFPTAMVLAFLIFSTIVAITDICMIKKIKTSTRLISFASCVVIITASIITMYIEWNPRVIDNPTGNIAYGMQGRYYIPLSLFVILPFSNGLLTKFKFKNQLILLEEKTMKLVSSCYLVLTALLLLTRYWI